MPCIFIFAQGNRQGRQCPLSWSWPRPRIALCGASKAMPKTQRYTPDFCGGYAEITKFYGWQIAPFGRQASRLREPEAAGKLGDVYACGPASRCATRIWPGPRNSTYRLGLCQAIGRKHGQCLRERSFRVGARFDRANLRKMHRRRGQPMVLCGGTGSYPMNPFLNEIRCNPVRRMLAFVAVAFATQPDRVEIREIRRRMGGGMTFFECAELPSSRRPTFGRGKGAGNE